MADLSLRELQRAHAAGRADARISLARAYLRQGRAGAALATLEDAAPTTPEAIEVHEGAWRDRLRRLERAWVSPSQRSPTLVGWCSGKAVLDTDPSAVRALVLLDRGDGRTQVIPGAYSKLVTPNGVLAGRWVGYDSFWLRGPDWQPEPLSTAQRIRRTQVEPSGERALLDGQPVLLPSLEPCGPSADVEWPWVVSWTREWIAWWAEGQVYLRPLAGGPVRRWDPALELRRRKPVLAAALGPTVPEAATLGFLDDGRLWVGPPFVVHDPDTQESWFPNGGDPRGISAPIRLSLDGQALLVLHSGKPQRLSLSGRPLTRAIRGATRGLWHPRAEVAVVFGDPTRPASLESLNGDRLRVLPRGIQPLGWTPEGDALLVQRDLTGEGTGPLELWRIPEAT